MEWKGIQISYNPLPQISLSSESVITKYTNASVSAAIPQAQAVSTNGSGQLVPLNISSLASVNNMVGYALSRIPASASGSIISNGRLLNFTTSYSIGTPLWIDTNGNPTNIVPQIGVNGFVSGDYVIFLGVVVANAISGTDIALFTQITGTL